MVAVFSIFATLSFVDVKTLGVGLAFAVLIDATVVRGLLMPAAMVLLGERCWYLPPRLAALPGLLRKGSPMREGSPVREGKPVREGATAPHPQVARALIE
jgi:hypothetical protein